MKKQQRENSENSTKRQRRVVGSVMEIHVNNEYYVYAQSYPYEAEIIFDYRTTEPLKDLNVLLTTKELFRVLVFTSVISKGHWKKVGKLPLRHDLLPPKDLCVYHPYDKVKYEIYNKITHKMRPANKEECIGLEPFMAWGFKSIEDRIRDHYNGVPCIWLKEFYECGICSPPNETK